MFLHLLSNDSSSFTNFMKEVPIDDNKSEKVSVKLGFSNNNNKKAVTEFLPLDFMISTPSFSLDTSCLQIS